MELLLFVVIPIIIAITVCLVLSVIALNMVIFSKAVFALVLTLPFSSNLTIFANSNLLNFLAWLSIMLAITFVLCLLPRFKNAYQLFCNILVSYMLAELIVTGVLTIIVDGYTPIVSVEIIIKVITVLFSLLTLYIQIINADQKSDLNNSVVKTIDRILASSLYAVIAVLVIVVSMDSLWTFPTIISWLIFISVLVLAFVVDKVFHAQIKQKVDSYRLEFQGKTGTRFKRVKKTPSNQDELPEGTYVSEYGDIEDEELNRSLDELVAYYENAHIYEEIEKHNRKIERQDEIAMDIVYWET